MRREALREHLETVARLREERRLNGKLLAVHLRAAEPWA
jgi:hypothetical protein